MRTHTLKIQGMSCGHCVMAVRKELSKVAAVTDVQIGSAVVEVDETRVSDDALRRAVAEAGYAVVEIK